MSDAVRAKSGGAAMAGATVGLALATVLLFSQSLYCGFINLDDAQYVVTNPFIRHPSWSNLAATFTEVLNPSTVAGYYQPLTMASLMLDRLIDGEIEPRPFIYHLTNVLLHACNAVLVSLWLRGLPLWNDRATPNDTNRLFWLRTWLPLILAAAYAWHPMNVEVVSWVCQRKALLSTTFALGALVCYGAYAANGGIGRYLLVAVLFALSMLAKPTTWLLPLAFVLLDLWPMMRLSRAAFVEKLPLFALAALGGLIAFVSQKQSMGRAELVLLDRPLIGMLVICHNMAFYLGKVLWPAHLSTQYPVPLDEHINLSNPSFLIGVIVCVGLTAAVILASRRGIWPVVVGVIGFACLLGPVLGAVDFMGAIAADRFVYLPMLMLLPTFAAFVLWLLRNWPASRIVLAPAAVAAVASLALATVRQQEAWQTSVTYWNNAMRYAPDEPLLWDGLASAYVERYYSNMRNPDGLDHTQDLVEAERWVRQSIEARPTYSRSYFTLGDILLMRGLPADALQVIDRGLACRDADSHGIRFRGQALSRLGRVDEAVDTYQRYLQLRRNDPLGHQYLANVLTIAGRFAEAEQSCLRALELDPTCVEAWYGLGRARVSLRNERGAIPAFEEAIRIAPAYALAHWALAACYATTGNEDGARRGLYVAIRLQPELLVNAEREPRFAKLRESEFWRQLKAAATQPAPTRRN